MIRFAVRPSTVEDQRCGFAADGVEHFYEVDGVPLPEVRYRLG